MRTLVVVAFCASACAHVPAVPRSKSGACAFGFGLGLAATALMLMELSDREHARAVSIVNDAAARSGHRAPRPSDADFVVPSSWLAP